MTFYLTQNLRLLRKARHLTQVEIARVLLISPQAYSHYENGRRMPSLDIICRIAGFYGITLDQLVLYKLKVNYKLVTKAK